MSESWGIKDTEEPVVLREKVGEGYKQIWVCPYYSRWKDMIKRCYYKTNPLKNSSYTDCYVCEEWRYFSNFRSWMMTQDWEGKQLDKDLLVFGNKVYSPETCCFLTPRVNTFITDRKPSKGGLPEGVSYHKRSGKYQAQCKDSGKVYYIGLFYDKMVAHEEYMSFKHNLALRIAEDLSCPRQIQALTTRYKRVKTNDTKYR